MSKTKTNKPKASPPTVITLTLPESSEEARPGTMLIARGDLAHVRQFTYASLSDLAVVIKDAVLALATVEADPPVIADTPTAQPASKPSPKPEPPSEPTVDVPLKKGTKAVKISHLKIVGGETDAAAYRQAVLLAGKLIDGKLWDGESPIRFDDVYATAKKMKFLTERDLSLFTLADFVQVGVVEAPVVDEESRADDEPLTVEPPELTAVSANGRHSENGASDQTTLL